MAFNISSTTSDDDIFKSLEYASTLLKIDRFKDLQVDAIKSALKGQDVFVNLPTGYGKSYGKKCYFHARPLCADYLRGPGMESETAASRGPGGSPGALPGSEVAGNSLVTSSSRSILLIILVSLMRDQVKSLKKRGLQTMYVHLSYFKLP